MLESIHWRLLSLQQIKLHYIHCNNSWGHWSVCSVKGHFWPHLSTLVVSDVSGMCPCFGVVTLLSCHRETLRGSTDNPWTLPLTGSNSDTSSTHTHTHTLDSLTELAAGILTMGNDTQGHLLFISCDKNNKKKSFVENLYCIIFFSAANLAAC